MSPTEVKLPVGEFATGLQFLKLKIIAEHDSLSCIVNEMKLKLSVAILPELQ